MTRERAAELLWEVAGKDSPNAIEAMLIYGDEARREALEDAGKNLDRVNLREAAAMIRSLAQEPEAKTPTTQQPHYVTHDLMSHSVPPEATDPLKQPMTFEDWIAILRRRDQRELLSHDLAYDIERYVRARIQNIRSR